MNAQTAPRVAIYARQSEDVAEGIERQLSRCRALIQARGYDLVREYLDNDTSAAKRRGAGTAWATMLADLAGGSAEVVVAVDLDRLLRDTRDLIAIMDTGARVLTVDGEIDLTTADGEFRATMLAGIARFEIRRKSERQLHANLDHLGRVTPSDVVVPIVSRELADEARAILADTSRRTSPGPGRRYLMSGLAVCGVCGGPLRYMRAYLCQDPSHVSILRERLEGRVREEIARALIGGGSSIFPVLGQSTAVSRLMAEHARNADAVTNLLADRDEGLVPPASARERLIALRQEREEIERQLDEARVSKSAASALVDAAQQLLAELPPEGTPYDDVAAAILARFDELDLDRQREIVSALLYVQVDPGRDARRRVQIEHLLAPSLNPWEQFDADD